MIDEGKAYYSYKTEEELEAQREEQRAMGVAPHYTYEYEGMTADEIKQAQDEAKAKGLKPVVRIHIPEMETYSWDDIVKGHLEFESDTIGGDFVIQKRDGMPTYNFAVVIDDHLMKITHVLRGDDHVSNTPKQLVVYEALGWKPPKFGHMTLIINSELVRSFLNVTNQFFNLLNNIVILVIYQKLCSTSLHFLVGHQRVKTKFSLSVNSSSNLIQLVCLNHLLPLTKRSLNGLTTNTSRRLTVIPCLTLL